MTAMTPVVAVHLATALAAVPLGAFVFLRRKGDRLHVMAGRAWGVLMLVVALSSFWITGLNGLHWSPIHLLSLLVVVMIPLAVWRARRGNVAAHRRTMIILYVNLLLAGAWAAVPGRTFGNMLWG